MTTRASSLLLLALLACGGGSSPPPAQPTPAPTPAATAPAVEVAPAANIDRTDSLERDFSQMTDEVCACADEDCLKETVERWSGRWGEQLGSDDTEPSEEMMRIAARLRECANRLVLVEDPDAQAEGERQLEQMTDEVCACQTKDCYDETMARWAEKASSQSGRGRFAKPTARMRELSERLGRCVTDIMTKSMPSAD